MASDVAQVGNNSHKSMVDTGSHRVHTRELLHTLYRIELGLCGGIVGAVGGGGSCIDHIIRVGVHHLWLRKGAQTEASGHALCKLRSADLWQRRGVN